VGGSEQGGAEFGRKTVERHQYAGLVDKWASYK
jgi:hypothetical protein